MKELDLPSVLQTRKDLDDILVAAIENDASDVHIGGEEPIKVRIFGEIQEFTSRTLNSTEVQSLLIAAYDENVSAIGIVNAGEDIDFAYVCKDEHKGELLRFRVNASSRKRFGKQDYTLVFRTINSNPPSVKDLGVEDDIVESMTTMTKGLAIVAGPTGSGKSTLLAAINRARLEQRSEVIITHEAPIEYVYDEIETTSVINQREIGSTGNYKTFYEALVGALRQDPDVILVGEARNRETINAALQGVQTGHALFTTVHTTGVPHTINRMLKEFEESEREAKLMDIIDSLVVIIYQNLVPSTDGKRVALREYLIFDGEVKDRLRECPVKNLFTEAYQALIERGQTLLMDAKKKLKEKRISKITCRRIEKQFEADISKTKIKRRKKSGSSN